MGETERAPHRQERRYAFTCQRCGNPAMSAKPGSSYCSPECSAAANKARKIRIKSARQHKKDRPPPATCEACGSASVSFAKYGHFPFCGKDRGVTSFAEHIRAGTLMRSMIGEDSQ